MDENRQVQLPVDTSALFLPSSPISLLFTRGEIDSSFKG